jgi:hypothetical protein
LLLQSYGYDFVGARLARDGNLPGNTNFKV